MGGKYNNAVGNYERGYLSRAQRHCYHPLTEVNQLSRRECSRSAVNSLQVFALLVMVTNPSIAFNSLSSGTFSHVRDATIGGLPEAAIRQCISVMSDLRDSKGAAELQQKVSQGTPVRSPLSRPQLQCCGLAASKSRELLVVGTAHTPCRSAEEVTAIIKSAKPDVVVIELDQERLEKLLRDDRPGERGYGEDFAAAAAAATSIGAPIILGDAKFRDSLASLLMPGPIFDGRRIARAFQLAVKSMRRSGSALRFFKPVSVLGTLYDDPGKLLPLLTGVWWIVLFTPFILSSRSDSGSAAEGWIVAFGYVVLTLVSLLCARVFDVVLIARDDVLSKSALRGLELADGLRTGELLRRRYQFSVDTLALSQCPLPEPGTIPFFTCRRPLRHGEVRKLNLFEPRWLCLLDSLAVSNAADDDVEVPPAPERLLNATFGCVFAVNRYYQPAPDNWSSESEADRIADVVVRPVARRARIIQAKQSARPVSGNRRLEIWMVGEEPLRLDPTSFTPTAGGYLAGKVTPCTEAEYDEALAPSPGTQSSSSSGDISRAVAVVGLAHANGVLDRCVEQKLQDKFAFARWLEEASADWVGY